MKFLIASAVQLQKGKYKKAVGLSQNSWQDVFSFLNLTYVWYSNSPYIKFQNIKGAPLWDFRSLGFSWLLHHKVSVGGRLWGDCLDFFFLYTLFNTSSSAAPQIPPCRRKLRSTQDCCNFGIDSRTLCSNHSARYHVQNIKWKNWDKS